MKIGFIGCGNMGGALAEAVSKNEGVSLLLTDKDKSRAEALAEKIGAQAVGSDEICRECEYVFLGVKPQGLCELINEIGEKVRQHSPVLVSMLAGVSTERIRSLVGKDIELIRIMPNTPVCYGKGLVFVSAAVGVSDTREQELCRLLSYAGTCEIIEESLMDAASAVGGSGPAFFYRFIDAVARGGEICGIPYRDALRYATLTAMGAAEMLLRSGKGADLLAQQVCSPGGSTIEGVGVLDNANLGDTVGRAVEATYKKAQTLGK